MYVTRRRCLVYYVDMSEWIHNKSVWLWHAIAHIYIQNVSWNWWVKQVIISIQHWYEQQHVCIHWHFAVRSSLLTVFNWYDFVFIFKYTENFTTEANNSIFEGVLKAILPTHFRRTLNYFLSFELYSQFPCVPLTFHHHLCGADAWSIK